MRLAALAFAVGLGTVGVAACGSSDAGSSTVPAVAPTTQPAVTTQVATAPAATDAPVVTTVAVSSTAPTATDAPAPAATEPQSSTISVTDADVADLEKQLDDIDQLLAGVDADLSQD